jgi:hypothetical protein
MVGCVTSQGPPIMTFTFERGGIARKKMRHDKLFRLFAGEIPLFLFPLVPEIDCRLFPSAPPSCTYHMK